MLNQNQQIFEQIKKAEKILITFSRTWSGDGVASALALFLFLKKLGKNVEIAAENVDKNESFTFLPSYTEIKPSLNSLRHFIVSLSTRQTKVNSVKYKQEPESLDFIVTPQNGFFTKEDLTIKSSGFKYDLIFVLDTRELESLGKIYDNDTELFYKVPVINIDHHPSNEEFGQINLIDLTAVSATEILFNLFEAYARESIDGEIATCLLTGMIAKTRSFKTSNVTPGALSVASQLIAMGGRREEIVNQLYRSRGLNVLKLWGLVLARLAGALENKLIWSRIKAEDFSKTESNENDLNEVIDELIINIPQAKVIVLFYETVSERVITSHGLIYAIKNLDAISLVQEFEPRGSKTLAQISLKKPLAEAEKEVIDLLTEKLLKLPV
jgi:phosphoesterase RecJ-like protein